MIEILYSYYNLDSNSAKIQPNFINTIQINNPYKFNKLDVDLWILIFSYFKFQTL